MRLCTIHGTDANCGHHTVGQCSGVLYDAPPAPEGPLPDGDDGEAGHRLAAFANQTRKAFEDERAEFRDMLIRDGNTPEAAERILNADGSPYKRS